jgi:hypothetical protein
LYKKADIVSPCATGMIKKVLFIFLYNIIKKNSEILFNQFKKEFNLKDIVFLNTI